MSSSDMESTGHLCWISLTAYKTWSEHFLKGFPRKKEAECKIAYACTTKWRNARVTWFLQVEKKALKTSVTMQVAFTDWRWVTMLLFTLGKEMTKWGNLWKNLWMKNHGYKCSLLFSTGQWNNSQIKPEQNCQHSHPVFFFLNRFCL